MTRTLRPGCYTRVVPEKTRFLPRNSPPNMSGLHIVGSTFAAGAPPLVLLYHRRATPRATERNRARETSQGVLQPPDASRVNCGPGRSFVYELLVPPQNGRRFLPDSLPEFFLPERICTPLTRLHFASHIVKFDGGSWRSYRK